VTATTTIDDAFVEGQVAAARNLPTSTDFVPADQTLFFTNEQEELVSPLPSPIDEEEYDEAKAKRMWEVSQLIRKNAPRSENDYRIERWMRGEVAPRREPKRRGGSSPARGPAFKYPEGDKKVWDTWMKQFGIKKTTAQRLYLPGTPEMWLEWAQEMTALHRPIFIEFLKYHPTLLSLAFRMRKSVIDKLGDRALKSSDDEQAKADAAAWLLLLVIREWVNKLEPFYAGTCNIRIRDRHKDEWDKWTRANTLKVDADPAKFKDGKYNLPVITQPPAVEHDHNGKRTDDSRDFVDLNTAEHAQPQAPDAIGDATWTEVKKICREIIYEDYFSNNTYFHTGNRLAIATMWFFDNSSPAEGESEKDAEKRKLKKIVADLGLSYDYVRNQKDSMRARFKKLYRDNDRNLQRKMLAWRDPANADDAAVEQYAFEYQAAFFRGLPVPGAARLRELFQRVPK
jgi:hypothetical protein